MRGHGAGMAEKVCVVVGVSGTGYINTSRFLIDCWMFCVIRLIVTAPCWCCGGRAISDDLPGSGRIIGGTRDMWLASGKQRTVGRLSLLLQQRPQLFPA